MPGRRTLERTFFSPAQSTVPALRFPPSSEKLLARELAPDTVVIARPTGGHFGSQICESAQERHHVLFRHGEMKVGLRCSLSVTAFSSLSLRTRG